MSLQRRLNRTADALERRWQPLFKCLAILSMAGCGIGDPVAPYGGPVTDPTQLYMSLRMNYRAVNLSMAAPYDKVQLAALPLDASGNPMTGLPSPTFVSTDTSVVTITPGGVMTAVGVGDAYIDAALTAGPVTRNDRALVRVTNVGVLPVLDSVAIHVEPGDSLIRSWRVFTNSNPGTTIVTLGSFPNPFIPQDNWTGASKTIAADAFDASGNPIDGLVFAYSSLNPVPVTVQVETGILSINRPGRSPLVAEAWAYGNYRADTADFTVTYPLNYDVAIQTVGSSGAKDLVAPPFGNPAEKSSVRDIRIAQFGLVAWYNFVGGVGADSAKVVFDDPTHVGSPPSSVCNALAGFFVPDACGTGNLTIPPYVPFFGGDPQSDPIAVWIASRWRQFPVAGIYPYHIPSLGISGRVIVVATADVQ